MTEQGETDTIRPRELTGRKVLFWFGGFFTLIISVNVVMVYLAITTFSGLETDDAYRKGRDYNETLATAARQNALGWSSRISLSKIEDGNAVLSVIFADLQGQPIVGLEIEANIRRPTTDRFDITISPSEAGNGEYRQAFKIPAPGNWLVTIEARNEKGDTYQVTDRVFIGS